MSIPCNNCGVKYSDYLKLKKAVEILRASNVLFLKDYNKREMTHGWQDLLAVEFKKAEAKVKELGL